MKTNTPTPGEVKKLITAAGDLQRLEQQRAEASQQLVALQKELRLAINETLLLPPAPEKELKDLVSQYRIYVQQGIRRPDRAVADLLAQEAELSKVFDDLCEKFDAEFQPLKKSVDVICETLRTQKLTDYQQLVGEIAGKITPYCEDDSAVAADLARQTPSARSMFSRVSSCDPLIYGRSNLLAPLNAALAILTSNPLKS